MYIENTSILINIVNFFISIWLCIIKDVIIFYTLIIMYLIFLWYKKELMKVLIWLNN